MCVSLDIDIREPYGSLTYGLESVGGATFCFLLGLVTYYLSLDTVLL